jgi:hypothetical protein
MSPGFVGNHMGLAARAGRLATKVKAAAPKVKPLPSGSPRPARRPVIKDRNVLIPKGGRSVGGPFGTGVSDAFRKQTQLNKIRRGSTNIKPKVVKPVEGTKGASDPRHRTTAGRAEIRREGEARLANQAAKARENRQRARTAKPKPTASDILAKRVIQSSERQNQRAKEALGSGKVDFEKRLSNVKPGQTKASDWDPNSKSRYVRRRASGESHADIMAQSKAKTQSMKDELAQLNARKASRDKASAVRGARREGGLRTRITPEQQANRDRARQRVANNPAGESYADFRKRTFGSRTSPTILPNPTKPGDRDSVLAQARKARSLRSR